MPYGRANFRSIKDGIWEPLWGGRRVLVDVFGREVRIRDEKGESLEGYDLIKEILADAALTDELVLDGYLLPAPLPDSAGADAGTGLESVPSAGKIGRQLLMGGGGASARKEAQEAARARSRVPAASAPTAFIGIDLLWLDGESLIDVPLAERKRQLDGVLREGDEVRLTVSVRPPVEVWFAQWRALGFREAAVKSANSRYTPGEPNQAWATMMIPRR